MWKILGLLSIIVNGKPKISNRHLFGQPELLTNPNLMPRNVNDITVLWVPLLVIGDSTGI